MPLHLAYVATLLPCETLMSAKQALGDILQDSVAAYLRCGGIVNNQIKKGSLLRLWVKNFFKWVNFWQSYKQERDCLVHFLRLLPVGLPDLPHFTGDPVFQTLSPASHGKPPGRTNLPYSVSQILASLRRHCDT